MICSNLPNIRRRFGDHPRVKHYLPLGDKNLFIIQKCLTHVVPKFLDIVGNKAKERISKRVFQENKARQIFRKTNISYPLIRTCISGCKKRSFFRKFGVLCFLETPVLRFAILPYYPRYFNVIQYFAPNAADDMIVFSKLFQN